MQSRNVYTSLFYIQFTLPSASVILQLIKRNKKNLGVKIYLVAAYNTGLLEGTRQLDFTGRCAQGGNVEGWRVEECRVPRQGVLVVPYGAELSCDPHAGRSTFAKEESGAPADSKK